MSLDMKYLTLGGKKMRWVTNAHAGVRKLEEEDVWSWGCTYWRPHALVTAVRGDRGKEKPYAVQLYNRDGRISAGTAVGTLAEAIQYAEVIARTNPSYSRSG